MAAEDGGQSFALEAVLGTAHGLGDARSEARRCVHFDLVYAPSGVIVAGHPGARSMGTQLVGKVELENGEQVFVTSLVRKMGTELSARVETLRSATVLDGGGKRIDRIGMLAFGTERNPDANDGTLVGTVIDVTRPDKRVDDQST